MQHHTASSLLRTGRKAGLSAPTAHGPLRQLLVAAAIAGFIPATTALAAGPMQLSSPMAAATSNNAFDGASGGEVSSYARHLALLINQYRAHRGLAPLELALDLSAIASEHSTQMAQYGRLSHDGFYDRFDRTRARLCVENVGMNFPHAEAQLDGWRASPGHHRNLLEPKVARMGIARSRTFVTFFACS